MWNRCSYVQVEVSVQCLAIWIPGAVPVAAEVGLMTAMVMHWLNMGFSIPGYCRWMNTYIYIYTHTYIYIYIYTLYTNIHHRIDHTPHLLYNIYVFIGIYIYILNYIYIYVCVYTGLWVFQPSCDSLTCYQMIAILAGPADSQADSAIESHHMGPIFRIDLKQMSINVWHVFPLSNGWLKWIRKTHHVRVSIYIILYLSVIHCHTIMKKGRMDEKEQNGVPINLCMCLTCVFRRNGWSIVMLGSWMGFRPFGQAAATLHGLVLSLMFISMNCWRKWRL